MRKIAAAFIGLLLSVSSASAKSAGTTAVPILQLGAGARGLAMGGAYSVLAQGADALFWNPAGLASQNQFDVTLNHQPLMNVLNYDAGSFAWPGKSSGFALGYSQLQSDSIQALDDSGNLAGNFKTKDQVISAGAGQRWNRWDAGISGEYIRSSLGVVSATAFALGAGVNAPSYWGGKLQHGVVIQNLGGKIKYDQKGDDLPRQAKFATLFRPVPAVRVGADLIESKTGLDYALGGEFEKTLVPKMWVGFLRAGYTSTRRDVASGLAFGGGLLMKQQLQLDFSWIPQTDFGSSEVFTLAYRFNAPAPKEKTPVVKKREVAPIGEYVAPTPVFPAPVQRADFGNISKRPKVYVVKEGDSLKKIADQYYGDKRLWTVIFSANRLLLDDPENLVAGQKIVIPPGN